MRLPYRLLVEPIPRALSKHEDVLVGFGRPVRHRLGHRIGLRPHDVGTQPPAVRLQRERDTPRDADEILRFKARLTFAPAESAGGTVQFGDVLAAGRAAPL